MPLSALIHRLLPAALLLVPLCAGAQEDTRITEDQQIGDWLLRCIRNGEGAATRSCFMGTNAVHALEQRELAIFSVGLVAPEDKQGAEEFAGQVTSPTFINVRAGIDLQVDQQLIANIAYEICTANNCISSFALLPAMVEALSQGFAAALIFTDAEGVRVSAPFSLNGFARGLAALEAP